MDNSQLSLRIDMDCGKHKQYFRILTTMGESIARLRFTCAILSIDSD